MENQQMTLGKYWCLHSYFESQEPHTSMAGGGGGGEGGDNAIKNCTLA